MSSSAEQSSNCVSTTTGTTSAPNVVLAPSPSTNSSSQCSPTTTVKSAVSSPVKPQSQTPIIKDLSRLCLGGEIVQVPTAIIKKEELFRAIITKQAYKSLSADAQKYLKRFLPKYDGSEKDEEIILDGVFTKDPNFYFGNPIQKFHAKVRRGWFNPERPSEQVQLRDNRRVLYDHYIRHYYISLLRRLLISRYKLLTYYSKLGAGEEPAYSSLDLAGMQRKKKLLNLRTRAAKRSRLMFENIRKITGDEGESSDEQEFGDQTRVELIPSGKSTLANTNFLDLDLHQPIYMDEVTEMLKEYRRRKVLDPNLPSMDISGISLGDIYDRAGLPCNTEKNLSAEMNAALRQSIRCTK